MGYIIYYGPTSGGYTNAVDVGRGIYTNIVNVGPAIVTVVSNLVEGATYYFVVTAYNTSGLQSAPSNEVHYDVPMAPRISQTLDSGVWSEGASLTLVAGIQGVPTPAIQWYFNDRSIGGATNSTLLIPSGSLRDSGTYYVTASNASGTVTSGEVEVAVVNVEPLSIPGLVLPPEVATNAFEIIYCDEMSTSPRWLPLVSSLSLSNSLIYIDWSSTNTEKRFYRGAPEVRMVPWIFPWWGYTNAVGNRYTIEFTDLPSFLNWQLLTNLTITSDPFIFVDLSATNGAQRIYRSHLAR